MAQRATSTSGQTASLGYFATDRMNLSVNGMDGRLTMSQDSDSPDGFTNSLKFDCTTAQSSLDSTDVLLGFKLGLKVKIYRGLLKEHLAQKTLHLAFM